MPTYPKINHSVHIIIAIATFSRIKTFDFSWSCCFSSKYSRVRTTALRLHKQTRSCANSCPSCLLHSFKTSLSIISSHFPLVNNINISEIINIAMGSREKVVTLYKTLYFMGKEYPKGKDWFHPRLKTAFLKNKVTISVYFLFSYFAAIVFCFRMSGIRNKSINLSNEANML